MRPRFASLLLFALTCVPLLLAVPFPTQDGPAHLYTAHVSQALADSSETALLHRFFAPSPASTATRAGTWMVQWLSRWCGPTYVPSLLIFATAAGLLLAISLNENGRAPCFFPRCFIPLACYSFVVRMGFFSFCLALPLVVLTVRLWLARTSRPWNTRLLYLAAALAVITFLHPVPALWVLVVCAAATASSIVVTRRGIVRESTLLALGSIPLLLISVSGRSSGAKDYAWDSIASRLAGILAGGPFVGLQGETLIVSSIAAILLVLLGTLALVDQLRQRAADDPYPLGLLAAVSAALLLALFSPEAGLGGGYVGVRCQLLLFLLLLECTRRWHIAQRTDVALSVIFLTCSMLIVGSMLVPMRRCSAAYREIMASATALPHSTTVLAVIADDMTAATPDLNAQVRPLLHAGDLLGLAGDRVLLANYQADLGYFATAFRPGTTPFGVLFEQSLFGWGPPWVYWDRLLDFHGGVEHLGIWNEGYLLRSVPNAAQYRDVICEHYQEVYRSTDWPWVIYRLSRAKVRGSEPAICG